VQVRDQRPMPAKALKQCLVGMTPAEWFALINSKVFFWLDVDRLNRQRRACEPRPQVVIEIDTEGLLAHHAERMRYHQSTQGTPAASPRTVGDALSSRTRFGSSRAGRVRHKS